MIGSPHLRGSGALKLCLTCPYLYLFLYLRCLPVESLPTSISRLRCQDAVRLLWTCRSRRRSWTFGENLPGT